ncbi:helix-turn-helix domain-containing protein [Vibrio neonatus]|uniref:helix-turn-helix domain-containing protein n=1 Tax=Vibrio neonatus TaxID=278860 RepID=UPI0021C39301|nr:helix-turn-helix domain-containing protein [Vibrio neonatus]
MQPQTTPLLHSIAIPSVELLNESLKPWGLDFIQLEKGIFHTHLTQLQLPQAVLQKISFDKQVWQRGVAPAECLNIGIMTQHTGPICWNNAPIQLDTLEVFSSSDGFDVISPAGFEAYTFSVHKSVVESYIEKSKLLIDCDLLLNSHQIHLCTPQYIDGLTRIFSHMLSETFSHQSPLAQTQTVLDLTNDLLLQLETKTVFKQRTSKTPRDKVIKRALDYILENIHSPINLSEICAITHTSLRTLDRCFKEKFQASPKTIIIALRLHAFRKMLISHPEQKIYQTASLCGFWHMGKLSEDYFSMFGELPSQTKRANERAPRKRLTVS